MELCVICKESLTNGQQIVVLREKGSIGINKASTLRNNVIQTTAGQSVHQTCRHQYCNKNVIERDIKKTFETPITPSRILRSEEPEFYFAEHCLFCGQPAKLSGKKRGYDVFPVRTSDFQTTVQKVCREREDSWSQIVYSRIEFAQDLHAVDAVYHQVCNVNFRTGKQIPLIFQSIQVKKQISGRPKDISRDEAFLKVADYLKENDDEQITVGDLVKKMEEFGCQDVYSVNYMKKKLQNYFENDVIITNINGKASVVTFRRTALSVLNEFYQTPKLADSEAEKMRIVKAVADLIRNDIKCIDTSKNTYPTPGELSSVEQNSSFLPESLRLLLRTIFTEKNADVKIASVGQAIVQAARPRVLLAPLQIGLAVQMHHHFASKFLIDSLHSHGFCSSYSEVKRFEMCSAKSQGTDIPGLVPGQFVQFVADNADHNINTLDGFNTFHGMGIIAAVTPGTKCHKPVPRCCATKEDLAILGKIDIHYFKALPGSMLALFYDELQDLSYADPLNKLDLLWKVVWPLRSPRPGWSGMMQTTTQGQYPGQSSITFMPMIDMNATDMSCVYSTLKFVCNEARRHKVHPVLTFDQPLWWKAQIIVASEPNEKDLQSIVLRLGGFHTEMSFLGSIGHMMRGSGLQELLEIVYAPNTVPHMLSGKALARAVRGHFLVDSTLNAILVAKAFNVQLPLERDVDDQHELQMDRDTAGGDQEPMNSDQSFTDTDDNQNNQNNQNNQGPSTDKSRDIEGNEDMSVPQVDEDLIETVNMYDQLMSGEVSPDFICLDASLSRVQQKLQRVKTSLTPCRTARLWLQYMEMVDLLRQFIKAERTGNWFLHLKSLRDMLPYFAAAGHNMYAKSVYIYLQQMIQLETQKPDVFELFKSGYHVIRRSDRYWAGLSSDLVIEQVLMRNMKTTGGLTRGRGMSESQRTQWLLSMIACTEVNSAMQELANTDFVTSDQHKDMTDARQKRDDKDTVQLLEFLQDRNPFTSDPCLRNIASGVVADESVNADVAKEVGQNILESMKGCNVIEYTFKKKDQVVSICHKSAAKVDGESIHVDPQLLFQRLVIAARNVAEDVTAIFKYELCTPPSSLFESSGLLRQANKPALADALWTLGKGTHMSVPAATEEIMYVLDGGSLLQRLPWPRNTTFGTVCSMYVDYVKRKYLSQIVVFDGYETGPTTKDVTHLRRLGRVVGAQVNFVEDMPIKSKKEQFLANTTNKQRFINMLSKKLQENGCQTVHAEGDADLLIAQTAVQSASKCSTTVIGEDTDLLILLCFHAKPTSFSLLLKSEGRTPTKKQKIWNIHQLQNALGPDICPLLPFVHAIAGCDTTSRLFGIGKGTVLRKLTKDNHFRQQAEVFCREASQVEITVAGEEALTCLYNGMPGEGLDTLRYRRFFEKVSTSSTFVQVHSLPPTAAAAHYHSARVYLQIQQWMDKATHMNPEDWGWIQIDGKLQPRTTYLPPAPDALLRIIRCNCKSDCETRKCTCKRHGLECSIACGDCKGISCTNSSNVQADNVGEEL